MVEISDQAFTRVLGRIISHVRKERGLSQEAFAGHVGITQSMLSRIEQGLATPDAQVFRKLADGIDKKPDDLYRLVDEAEKRAQKLVVDSGGKQKSSGDWLAAAVAIFGVVGIASLIGVAVAAILESKDSK